MAMKLRSGPPEEKKQMSAEAEDNMSDIKPSLPVIDENINGVVQNPVPTAPTGNNGYTLRIAGRTFNSVILITHLNICLYATCFWIQIGALPVSMFANEGGIWYEMLC